MRLSGSNIRKTSYIFSNECFSYISENKNPEKIPYISESRTFLYFNKLFITREVTFQAQKKFLVVQEKKLSSPKLKMNLYVLLHNILHQNYHNKFLCLCKNTLGY